MLFRIIFTITFMFPLTVCSQSFTLYGDKTFGGDEKESWVTGVLLNDNTIVMAGISRTNISGDKTDPFCDTTLTGSDLWMLKIDTAFNIIWNKSLGGKKGEGSAPILHHYNNEILMSAGSPSDSSCEKSENCNGGQDYWIYSCDTDGNKLWDASFGGSSTDYISNAVQLSSGNYIVCGASGSPISGDKTISPYNNSVDYWVVKFDSSGTQLWDKSYGGDQFEFSTGNPGNFLFEILPEDNDGFLIAGTTNSSQGFDISDTSRGELDIWIIKIDSSGNKIWDKRFGGLESDYFGHIIHTNDNGYIITGLTNSPQGLDLSDGPISSNGDCWILKIDSSGNKQWDKRYGGEIATSGKFIQSFNENGYLVSGDVNGGALNDVSEPAYGNTDYWIFRIDSVGNKLWDKRFGGPYDNYSSNFLVMPDSSIFLFGVSDTGISTIKTDFGKGFYDYWVVHFKYELSTELQEYSNQFELPYPNPTSGTVNIPSELSGANVLINDITGRIVLKQENISTTIELAFLIDGCYFLNFEKGTLKYNSKLMLSKNFTK